MFAAMYATRWARWSWAPLGVAVPAAVVLVTSAGDAGLSRLAAAGLVVLVGVATSAAVFCAAAAVSARRAACSQARQLAESQAWTSVVLETAVEGIITINEAGRVESFNRAAERIFGYRADEVIGRSVSMLMPPPENEHHDGYVAHYLQTGQSKGIGRARERQGRRKDGTVFALEVAVSEVRYGDRRLFVGICHDISKRKAAEEELAASRSFLQTVIDGIPDLVMVIDREYRVVLANRAVRETAGGQDPVSSFLRCYQASHHCEHPCEGQHVCPLETVVSSKATVTVTHTHYDGNGNERLMEIIAAPILDESGEVVQIIEACRDVTARVRAENQARQRQAELAHLARLGTMGEMAAGLAHELNQPLSAIVNYTQACLERLRAGAVDVAGLRADLEAAAAQAERAGDVIEQVRAFVRKADPQRSRSDLNELVREALGLLRSEIRQRNVNVQLELHENLPGVHVVPIQIVQVIVNLVQNALEAMQSVPQQRRRLHIATANGDGRQVVLTVRDGGEGPPDAALERVFDPFFTTKPEGMGMGLAICRSIVEAHGGRIALLPAEDGGALARFTLPAVRGTSDDAW